MHGTSNGTISYPNNVCCIYTRKVISSKKLDAYHDSLIGSMCEVHACECCGNFINSIKKYCSASCRATVTNKLRGPRQNDTKAKISDGVRAFNTNTPRKPKNAVIVRATKPKIVLALAITGLLNWTLQVQFNGKIPSAATTGTVSFPYNRLPMVGISSVEFPCPIFQVIKQKTVGEDFLITGR